jgi:hypothetical protein
LADEKIAAAADAGVTESLRSSIECHFGSSIECHLADEQPVVGQFCIDVCWPSMRNPVDAVGVWYRDLPYWRRLLLALIAFPIVAWWWLAYEFRRGWFGPPAE